MQFPFRFDPANEVLAFELDTKEYGINMLEVQEIRDVAPVTYIAKSPEQIRPPYGMGTALNTDYLVGVDTLGARMIILNDIDRLISSANLGLVEPAASTVPPSLRCQKCHPFFLYLETL